MIDIINEKANLVDQWRAFYKDKYGDNNNILLSDSIGLSKFKKAIVMFDTCYGARATSKYILDEI